MTSPATVKLAHMEAVAFDVTPRTTWTFVEITDADGAKALVEVTGPDTAEVIALLKDFITRLSSTPVAGDEQAVQLLGLAPDSMLHDMKRATAVSALRTAVVELQALHAQVSLTEQLGGATADSVPLYGNINRALLGDRTPDAFARMAERAVAAGFRTIKCAPFDEAVSSQPVDENVRAAQEGLRRVSAIRSAVCDEITVLVDCHSRFTPESAPAVAERLHELGVGWFEEPLQPLKDADGLSRLAKQIALPLAGGESGYGTEFFVSLVKQQAVKTVMPDVKYCGGVVEACSAGRAVQRLGGHVSLHSPSGPVSQLASAHVTAAVPGDFPLEHAFGETDWRPQLLTPPENICDGRIYLQKGPGLGAAVSPDAVERFGRRWTP